MMKRAIGLVIVITFLVTGCTTKVSGGHVDLKNSIMYVVTNSAYDKYFLYSLKGTKKSLVAETRNEISANLINEKQLLVSRGEAANWRTGTIFLTSLTGRVRRRIARGKELSYLKNKNLIVFSSDDISETGYFIFMKELGRDKAKQLTFLPKDVIPQNDGFMYTGDWGGDISRDGKHLIYISSWYHQGEGSDWYGKGIYDLFIKNLKTGATRKLASLVSTAGKFSSEGSNICFIDKHGNAVIVDVHGKQLHKFRTKQFKRRPHSWPFTNWIDWSQDDKQLIIWDSSAIFQLSVKDGSIKNLVRLEDSKQQIWSVAPFDN